MNEKAIKDQFEESYANVIGKMEGWVNTVIVNLPNLLIAIGVFGLAYFLSGYVKKFVERGLRKHVRQASLRSLIATFASIVVILSGLFIALGVMKLETVLKSLLAGAGVAGLAIGLALQSSLSNTFSGIYLSVRDVLNVGDWIETNGYQGIVHEVNLRNTVIRESDNNLVMIPNKMVVENPFKNYGLTRRIRVILKCGVSYSENLRKVERVARESIAEKFPPDERGPIEFHYLGFGDSSIDFQLRFWIDATANRSIIEARSEAIMILKEAFDRNDIEIPFPIRTIYMRNNETDESKNGQKTDSSKQ